jgi:hypothetical protein
VTSTRATDVRAILVSQHQRDILRNHHVVGTNARTTTGHLAEAFDNAGDQPRIRWCLEHGNVVLSGGCPARKYMIAQPCRVVTAIVVPLEEDA